MKRSLLSLLLIPTLMPAMQQSPKPEIGNVIAHSGMVTKYPALVFLKVIYQTQKDLDLSINYGTIGSLKQSIENKYFEKAIPFTYHSLSSYGNGEIWNSDVHISYCREKKYIQTHLEIERSSVSWSRKLSYKLKGHDKKVLASRAIDIDPSKFDDVCLVTLQLAGEHLEQSTMEVEHLKSSYLANKLRECEANLNGVDKKSLRTPLINASSLNEEILIQFLVKAGADIHWRCPLIKSTALHTAVFGGSDEIVELLLKHGADQDINIQDRDGNTPLHRAVKRMFPQTKKTQLLIKYGAKLNIRNNEGYMPIGLAWKRLESGHEVRPVYELLKQAHIDRHHAYTKEQAELMHATRNMNL